MKKGIDVSRWQGLINWPIVAQNVDFAFIKLGGSDVGFYADGSAIRNVLEARSQNIPLGFYVYLGGAFSVADEVAHIKNLISNIGGLKTGEVFALDWEAQTGDEVGYVAGIAKGLIDAGINPPLIYMSLSRVRGNNWQRLVDLNCGLWVAAWGNNDDIPQSNETPGSDEWPFWAFWQYSSTGSIPGIAGRVDLDLFASDDINKFKEYGNKRNTTMPAPTKTTQVVLPSSATGEYIVVPGDNLSAIAARYRKSWQELWAINRDKVSDPNKIFPGLKLRVWADGSEPNPPAPVAPPVDNSNFRYHTVENGENLSVIASRYGLTSWSLIYEANRDIIGSDPNLIRPGQRLRIP